MVFGLDQPQNSTDSPVEWSQNPQIVVTNEDISDPELELAGEQELLPDGWYVARDPTSGLLYYYTLEGKSSWEPPRA